MRPTILLLLLIGAIPARATDYRNRDSLQVGSLLYVGGIERHVYAAGETIQAFLEVVNRTAEPDSIWYELECDPIGHEVQWCFPAGQDTVCTMPEPTGLRFCIGTLPPTRFLHVLPPGRFVLREMSIPPPRVRPEGPGALERGNVLFSCQWCPPYFRFEVTYRREPPLAVADRSWTAVRQLYR